MRATLQPVKLKGMDLGGIRRKTHRAGFRSWSPRTTISIGGDSSPCSRIASSRCAAARRSAADAVRMTAELQPDVVLLDLGLADGDSIPRIAEMLEAHPGVKVVVFSSSADRDSFLRSLRAGAAGFLSRTVAPRPRARAARAAAGRGPISRLLTMHLVTRSAARSPARDRGARARSRPPHAAPARDPAHARGRRNDGRHRDGAHLSVETVRGHIKSILRKLGVRSRADAIACLEELQAV